MRRMTKKLLLGLTMAALALSLSANANAQGMVSSSGAALVPDDWLLANAGPARWYKTKPSVKPVILKTRAPTVDEQAIIERVKATVSSKSAKAFVLMDGANIVHVEYKAPANSESTFFGFSMGKTVTSMAVGQAICAGKLSLETKAAALIPDLTNTTLGSATVRDLLMMASGTAEGNSDSSIFTSEQAKDWNFGRLNLVEVITQERVSKAARGVFSDYKPGERFDYKSTDPMTLGVMVSRATGIPFSHWVQETVLNPMGAAQTGFYVQDFKQNGASDAGTRLRMEDWMRFALWVKRTSQEKGCFGDYVREAMKTQIGNKGTNSTRKFGKLFGGYGYLIWTQNEIAPNTAWANGYGGQRISWSEKSDRMVIVFSNVEDWMTDVYEIARDWDRIEK